MNKHNRASKKGTEIWLQLKIIENLNESKKSSISSLHFICSAYKPNLCLKRFIEFDINSYFKKT